jgi:hypothetical protein
MVFKSERSKLVKSNFLKAILRLKTKRNFPKEGKKEQNKILRKWKTHNNTGSSSG